MQACNDSHPGNAPPVSGGTRLAGDAGLTIRFSAALDQGGAIRHRTVTRAFLCWRSNEFQKQTGRKPADNKVPA
jgi:hypothetical protein